MNADAMSSALVLGGGGITGIAWEIGLLHGLHESGVDLTDADTVVGTSAGSVVGAQLTSGAPLSDLYAAQLEDPSEETAATFGRVTLVRYAALLLAPGSGTAKRRRLGRASVKAAGRPGAVPVEERVRVIRERLVSRTWPERDLRVTAVDADSGAFVVFDRHGDVDLVHAVASSCAVPLVWPPVPVDGHRYVDGGVRSASNADVVRGADRVVVLAPLPRALVRRHRLPAQLSRTGATRTAVVSPDAASLAAIGRNVLDPAQRPAAARAGHAQAASVADRVREAWTDGPAGA
jgi:NTE family protein